MKRRRTGIKKKSFSPSSSPSPSPGFSPPPTPITKALPKPSSAPSSSGPSEKPLEVTGGDKPFSFDQLLSRRTYSADDKERRLKILRSIPIKLPDIPVKSDEEIRAIIKNSTTLYTQTKTEETHSPIRRPRRPPPEGKRPLKLSSDDEITAVVGAFSYGSNSCNKYLFIPHEFDDKPKLINNGARFILLVSTHQVVKQFGTQKVFERFECIVVSAEGPPEFLIRMATEFGLPVLALLDTSPHSLEILAFYGRELNNIKWIGIRPWDTTPDKLRKQYTTDSTVRAFGSLPMKRIDSKTLKIVRKDSYIKSRDQWLRELNYVRHWRQKVDLELLCIAVSVEYVARLLLPMKLQMEDWI